jgi:TM2 domain-containing membrane protein YozV
MKDKTVAALLALFIGWAGIHKFYLGESGAGIIYLLFFWTGIPAFIGFVECILLLTMSEKSFNAKYNRRFQAASSAPNFIQESTQDKANALGELKKLYDLDIITAEEYEAKRRKILDSI